MLFISLSSCGKTEEEVLLPVAPTSVSFTVRSVTIVPERPRSNEPLQAVVEPEIPPFGSYRYQWLKNGNELMGETESILKSEHCFKGDRIEVAVMVYQEGVKGKTTRSEPVVILNSPPTFHGAGIEPSPAFTRDELRAVVAVSDADGDYLRLAYQWERNGEEIPGAEGDTLSSDYFIKGDQIRYRVTISDGESEAVTFYAKAVTILNSPPQVDAVPSGRLVGASLYQCTVTAEDPDGDPIAFSLSAAPDGMTIHPATGEITWEIAETQWDEDYEFKVVVSDTEGALAIQPITVRIARELDSGMETGDKETGE